jgi:hypothetical protein
MLRSLKKLLSILTAEGVTISLENIHKIEDLKSFLESRIVED